ncbi:MAG: porin [Alistipes sp.]|nr:porin [Alistipes sp.]
MKKFLLALFLFGTFGVQAQNLTQEEMQAQIASLTEEVNTLQQKSNTWDKFTQAMPKISGYVMGRYMYNGDESTFRLRRVRVSVAGDLTPKLDYKFQAELSSFKLLDAYFNYKPFDQLKIKAGQFKVPFTIENTDYTPTKMILMDHPMVLDRLVGTSEEIGDTMLKTAGRELGIDLHGAFFEGMLKYDVAVFNGAGLNVTDNNKSKDVVARLMLTPVKGLTISGSYYWGEFGDMYYARERFAVGAVYDCKHFLVRAEYIGAKTGLEGQYDVINVDQEGWYALAGWRINEKWMMAARYDTFTEDTEARSATEQVNYTFGVAWKPYKFIRLQANYVHEDRMQGFGHRNVGMVQATLSF